MKILDNMICVATVIIFIVLFFSSIWEHNVSFFLGCFVGISGFCAILALLIPGEE